MLKITFCNAPATYYNRTAAYNASNYAAHHQLAQEGYGIKI